ncbi:hypothetical protein SeMB42_g06517 [Synchytrium endobioticum]|uniref:Glutathione transferase n=1 Tax=Synchytrium endobioticum TaxID=286115 RepID=A0A507CKQ2_9FUNG|nr:hypothetical protein SeMB42_g06517 [Synchytrium endobioticum]TPX48967.1 hypothetical protein SeLEV6574_g01727 [Synchytrium endobioticum]
MAPLGKLHSYPNNPRAAKVLIAAKYNGLEVEQCNVEMGVTNKSPEFLSKFPLGKVPTFETPEGFTLYESNAIAYFVAASSANTTLLGKDKFEASRIQQFIGVADNELAPAQATWIYPILGWFPAHEGNTKKAIEDTKRVMKVLNLHLKRNTYLVGEAITLADISMVTALLSFYRMVFDPAFRSEFKNVTRWFVTCVNQPHFKAVLGDVILAEKVATVDKAEKVAASSPKKATDEKRKEAPKPKKKDDDEEEEESYEDEAPKGKNPLDLLPPSTFVLDSWKRFYSNNDTRPTAVNWFWENYDPAGFSMWKVVYKYNSELTMTFMSSNLVGGFFQRLERARKYAFGSLVVLGEDNQNEISGYFVVRGLEVPAEIKEAADYESYEWIKVNTNDPSVREGFNAYIAWDEVIEGKKYADGKIFK